MKDQIQFETNGLTVLAVKVPSKSYDFHIVTADIFSYRLSDKDSRCQTLGPGKWKIHVVTDELNNEQAKLLVEVNEPISRW